MGDDESDEGRKGNGHEGARDTHDPDAALDPDDAKTDEPVGADDLRGDDRAELHSGLPPRIESWRRRSAVGAILTGFALGLREALEPRRNEPSIVMETSGEPPTDLPVEAQLEQIRPRQSVVKIRPWLLPAKAAADHPTLDGPDLSNPPESPEPMATMTDSEAAYDGPVPARPGGQPADSERSDPPAAGQ